MVRKSNGLTYLFFIAMKKFFISAALLSMFALAFFSVQVADSVSDINEFYLPIFGGLNALFLVLSLVVKNE